MICMIHCYEQHCSLLWTALFIVMNSFVHQLFIMILMLDVVTFSSEGRYLYKRCQKDSKRLSLEWLELGVLSPWKLFQCISWFIADITHFTRFIQIADIQPIIQVGWVQGWECLGSPGSSCERYRNFASQWISFIWHHPLRLEYDFIYPIICTYCMYIHSELYFVCTLLDTTLHTSKTQI